MDGDVQTFDTLELSYVNGKGYITYYDDMAGGAGRLSEEEIRRLHSFLSQWLETNQKDYF